MDTPMTPQLQRAIRMILYMESIPPEQFDIREWVTRLGGTSYRRSRKNPECGTVCCFIGHLPFCFPETFYHKENAVKHHREFPVDIALHTWERAARFFGLSDEDMKVVIFSTEYEQGGDVSKDVVVGRFLDRIKRAHGIEDMDAALRLMRERIKEERKEDATVHKAPVQ